MMDQAPFLQALAARAPDRTPIIAELKCRTGRNRDLMRGRSVEEIVTQYRTQGACALSVVTGRWFGGTPDLLRQVAAHAGNLPILRKDFLCSPAALEETARLGASAALITCKLLRPSHVALLLARALELILTPFIEVSSEAELDSIPVGLPIVLAVNNADIETHEAQGEGLARSLRLIRAMAAKRPGAIVSASGITQAEDAAALVTQGFDGLLIGTGLMDQPTLLRDITRLTNPRPTVYDARQSTRS